MSKLIVIGTKRLTLPLTVIGFEPVIAQDAKALAAELDQYSVDTSVALIVCGESQACDCPEAIARFRNNGHGVVLVVADGPEPQQLGYKAIRERIEQAAGVDLLGRS